MQPQRHTVRSVELQDTLTPSGEAQLSGRRRAESLEDVGRRRARLGHGSELQLLVRCCAASLADHCPKRAGKPLRVPQLLERCRAEGLEDVGHRRARLGHGSEFSTTSRRSRCHRCGEAQLPQDDTRVRGHVRLLGGERTQLSCVFNGIELGTTSPWIRCRQSGEAQLSGRCCAERIRSESGKRWVYGLLDLKCAATSAQKRSSLPRSDWLTWRQARMSRAHARPCP